MFLNLGVCINAWVLKIPVTPMMIGNLVETLGEGYLQAESSLVGAQAGVSTQDFANVEMKAAVLCFRALETRSEGLWVLFWPRKKCFLTWDIPQVTMGFKTKIV